MTSTTLMPKQKAGRPRKHFPSGERLCEMTLTPTLFDFCTAMAEGRAQEIMCVGTRGDGKTIGALSGMLMHAKNHQDAGYALPTKWLGVTDTFSSHKAKTFESLEKLFWKGCWRQ